MRLRVSSRVEDSATKAGRRRSSNYLHGRGPYRTLGIGRDYVPEAIAKIRACLLAEARGLSLRVDYPMRDMPTGPDYRPSIRAARQAFEGGTHDSSGSKDRWQSVVWLSFFQALGFRKDRPEAPGDEVLALYSSNRGNSK